MYHAVLPETRPICRPAHSNCSIPGKRYSLISVVFSRARSARAVGLVLRVPKPVERCPGAKFPIGPHIGSQRGNEVSFAHAAITFIRPARSA